MIILVFSVLKEVILYIHNEKVSDYVIVKKLINTKQYYDIVYGFYIGNIIRD